MYKPMSLIAGIIALLLTSWPPLSSANTPSSIIREQVRNLQNSYRHLHSITFHFEQHTYSNGRIREGSGNASLIRTGDMHHPQPIMRWNYVSPNEQVLLYTDQEIQIYTKIDKQLIITPTVSMDNDITFALFSGHISIEEAFDIQLPPHGEVKPGMSTALLVRKTAHQQVQAVQIWFTEDHVLHRIRIDDHFGTQTSLTLSDFAINTIQATEPAVIQALAHINVPPETEIIHQ